MAIKTVALTSLIALGAAPAFAGSLTPPPAEPPVFVATPEPVAMKGDWTGFYGGVQLGGGKVTTDDGSDLEGQGGLGGVHLGYDYDFGDYVLGAGVEYDAGEIELVINGQRCVEVDGAWLTGDGEPCSLTQEG